MEQAVILHLKLTDNFGTAEERQALGDLQEELADAIEKADAGEFDGDEYGEGECVIYMYGPDADALYRTIEPIAKNSSHAKGGFAIKRYGETTDPAAREVRVELS